jgi:hypothetical protein
MALNKDRPDTPDKNVAEPCGVSGDQANPPTARAVGAYLQNLARALAACGLMVSVNERARFVFAKNEAASAGENPLGRAMDHGLCQIVVLSTRADHSLHWFWQWSGATRDAPPEYEYLCPAEDIDEAAERIYTVLRVESATKRAER